jgi:hypothetical protein
MGVNIFEKVVVIMYREMEELREAWRDLTMVVNKELHRDMARVAAFLRRLMKRATTLIWRV